MKRLPKGMRKLSKEEFSKEILLFQEEQHIPFVFKKKEYVEWSEKEQKKSTKKTYRW